MPRTENIRMLLHMPLPKVNFSNGPYVLSSSYQQILGYFPQYSSILQPTSAYPASIQQNIAPSAPFSHVAQGSYSMQPPGPQMFGPSYNSVAPANVTPPRPPARGRINFSIPGHHLDFSAFVRSSLTREKRTTSCL